MLKAKLGNSGMKILLCFTVSDCERAKMKCPCVGMLMPIRWGFVT